MSELTPDPLDDLASAHLDGAADAAEAARAAADPQVAERIAAFEAVREAIRSDVPRATAEARESAIRSALAAFDGERLRATATEGEDPSGGAVALRPRRLRPVWARAVGVAAAVVLLAAVVPVLLDDDGASDQDVTASAELERDRTAEESADAAGGAGTSEAADLAPPGSPEIMAATLTVLDLGAHADLSSLVAAARAQIDGAGADGPEGVPDPAVAACLQGAVDADGATEGVVALAGTALLADAPVAVVVRAFDAGGRTLVVMDPAATCAVLASEDLGVRPPP